MVRAVPGVNDENQAVRSPYRLKTQLSIDASRRKGHHVRRLRVGASTRVPVSAGEKLRTLQKPCPLSDFASHSYHRARTSQGHRVPCSPV